MTTLSDEERNARARLLRAGASAVGGPVVGVPVVGVTEIDDAEAALIHRIAKLERINAALMGRVERSMDAHGNAYSLFQTAISLELQVKARTEELTAVLHRLETTNEALRLAKEQAEQANAYKTRFLAAAGHDLLQPLSAARLSISALTELQSSAEARAIAGQVDRALVSIEDLLKTLLDISRLDAGVMQPEVKEVVLADIFAGLAADFERLAGARGLRFRVRPTDAVVRSDPVLLRRILQNLVSNAVRYTREGGVLLGVRHVSADQIAVEVADTGVGIPEAEHQTMFEEFRRGRGAGAAEASGLGLGLAIVRRMSAALGHDLAFQSEVGRGTRFRLVLPLVGHRRAVETAEIRPRLAAIGLDGARILVIDNDEAILAASASLLSRWSCRVATARSAEEALASLSEAPPDLVLADFHLDDDRTGVEAITRLRAAAGHRIPAVVMTADRGEAVAGAVAAVEAELMHKPVRPAELRALLAHMLG